MTKKLIYLNIIFGIFTASNLFIIQIGSVGVTLFRVTLLMILVWMFFTFFYKNQDGVIKVPKRNYYPLLFFLIWFLWGLISLGWVKDYGYWFETITHLALGIILSFIYSQHLTKRSDYLLALKIYSLMVLFHNVIGWYEILTKNYLFYSGTSLYWYQIDSLPVSSFSNINDYATFMFLSISILYVCFKDTDKLIGKIYYVGLMTSSLYLMTATGSRGALIGGILSISVFIFLNIKGTVSKRKVIRYSVLLTALFIFLVIFKSELFIALFDFFSTGFNLTEYIPTDLNDIRYRLIINGLYFLVRTFGLGVGAGNAQFWLANESIVPNSNILYLHNWFIEILVEYGLIIFILYIIFYYKVFKTSMVIFKKSKNSFDINFSLSVMVFMIGFIIVSFSSHSLVYNEWFWIYWAIIISYQWNLSLNENLNNS